MWTNKRATGNLNAWPLLMRPLFSLCLFLCPSAATASPHSKIVVVLYPDNADQSPGRALFHQGIQSTLRNGSPEHVEIYNEFIDLSRSPDTGQLRLQADHLQRKHSERKIDLIITPLASTMEFVLKYGQGTFPNVPVVAALVDQREVRTRALPANVIVVPIKLELTATLELALQLHSHTRRVFVISGNAPRDTEWETVARREFARHTDNLEFVYLRGLPMPTLLQEVARLPDHSIIYYLSVYRDGSGQLLTPGDVLERLALAANAPIYSDFDSYLGRGTVGGRMVSFGVEGKKAAQLGLRILAGERPETILAPEASQNTYMFDWRQLRRWGISEQSLPPDSVVRHKEPGVWNLYKWHFICGIILIVVEALLIAILLLHRARRRRAEEALQASHREMRALNSKLLHAQEEERRSLAREMHDDWTQRLAVLGLDVANVERNLPDPDKALLLLRTMQQLANLSEDMHALSRQLHPSILDDMGLVEALRSECAAFSRREGIVVDYRSDGVIPTTLSKDVALCLYRIAQEALRNIAKHAAVGEAWVTLIARGPELCLRVQDRGAGFDPAGVRSEPGLSGMGERARCIRAHFSLLRARLRHDGGGARPVGSGGRMRRRRILIADDHQILAEGLRALLEPEFEVVGIAHDGRELVAAAKKIQPDLIVADVAMPALNGIEAALQLRGLGVEAKVVFLTMQRDVVYARRAVEAGAAGFVLKHSAATELVTAVREAFLGKTYVTPMIAGELLQSYRQTGSRSQDPAGQLSPRQREVLQLFAEGHSAKEVAAILKISARTAEFHRARIKELLGIQTTAEMVQYAIRHGIVSF